MRNTEWRNDACYTRGPFAQVVAYRALCPDGVRRVTARVAASPDTAFSHPATVRVGRVSVRGFVTDVTDGARFVPYLASARPAGWLYDVPALQALRDDIVRCARERIGDARCNRWRPVVGGDDRAKNRRRCARLFARAVADVRRLRRDASRLGATIRRALAHNAAIPGDHTPFRVASYTAPAGLYVRDITYEQLGDAVDSARRTADSLRWAYDGRPERDTVRAWVVDASGRQVSP